MLSDFPSPWYIFIICEWDVKMKVSRHVFKAIIEPSIVFPAQITEDVQLFPDMLIEYFNSLLASG